MRLLSPTAPMGEEASLDVAARDDTIDPFGQRPKAKDGESMSKEVKLSIGPNKGGVVRKGGRRVQREGGRLLLRMVYLTAFVYGAMGLFLLWLSHRRHGVPWCELLGLGNPWQVFGLGTILASVLIGFEMAVATFVPDRLWADDGRNASFCEFSYLNIFLLMLLVGIGEELFFRAGLQRLLIDRLGSAAEGIALASAAFALLHPYWKKPLLMVSVFAMGAVMGWGYWFTGSIWTAAWCHFLVNFVMTLFWKKGDVPSPAVCG